MELIARFQSDTKDPESPITCSLHCQELYLDSEPAPFITPLTDKELAELRWYLELYWRWPTGPDYARAQKLESRLEDMGRRLWQSLFGHADAMRVAQQFLDAADDPKLLTIDAVEPRVLRLPWELLADEDGHVFNASPPIVVRRRLHKVKRAQPVQFDLPLRVLMVISRPEGVGFIDPRSSAVALLDALAPLGDQAQVEFLRPPTLKALAERLSDPDKPPVHVVHFDGHGVYDPNIGLGYLLFEDPDHQPDPVNANRLGTLLNQARIPLMVLDACQTGEAGDLNAFSSVAARLIQSGVGSVLAMNYSVLVETTRRLTDVFYRELARGRTIGQALDRARFDLLADTERHRIYRPASDREDIIHLHDWFLPVLYQQQADPAPFAAAPLTALPQQVIAADPIPRQPARGGFPPKPRHGFHGRARELLTLERTFATRRVVVLHGFGGQGKTALATEAAAWFVRTGLFRQAVFLSLERGGGLELALSELGNALVSPDFTIHQGDPVQAIAKALAAEPTLVVWDNFETILPRGDAALPPEELKALLDAGATWAGQGGSRLLITTRDTDFGHPAFEPGATTAYLPLSGLVPAEALELAGQILADRGIKRPPRRELEDLLRFLGGHPLSLQLVLPHLADPEIGRDVGKLIAEFEAMLPGFVEGKAAERNESLTLSLDFSLRRLGQETRALLPALAVFQGRAMEDDLLAVTEFDEDLWRIAREELRQASLITLEHLPGIQYPYTHFHPTLAPHLARLLDPQRRADLEERFRKRYHAVATYLYHADNRDPIPTRAIAVRELPNLRRALDLHLAAHDWDAAVDLADDIAYFLDLFGRWRERDVMMERVRNEATRRRGNEGLLTKAEFLLESQRGEMLRSRGQAREAEGVFRRLLALMDAGADYDTGYDRCLTLGRLGRSLAAQGRAGEAEAVYRQKLAALAALEQTDQVRRETGIVHTDLADVLRDQGRYAEARAEYEASLAIKQELGGEERGIAVVQGQLGTLAMLQGDLAEARRRYREALTRFRALGEERSQAIAWHQLGRVAEEGRDWAEAEHCYREALHIWERIDDKANATKTCNQLAIVAEGAGRPAEAERWYRRAIEMDEEIGNAKEVARDYNNLADLLLTSYDSPYGPRPNLAAAEEYARKAVAIMESLNDPSLEIWAPYAILAEIAERKGDAAAARAWRRKEQEAFAAFPGSWARLQRQFGPVVQAVVAAAQGNEEAKAAVEAAFPQLTEGGYRLEDPIRRIWAGERDVWALTEGLDRIDALIVRKILEALG
ncbi:MAG: tetratricopeptide repeat protein [Chloroflexi bacterium]|nr:tetratricopeptide repeat protein [Chloroflexota bacterium]